MRPGPGQGRISFTVDPLPILLFFEFSLGDATFINRHLPGLMRKDALQRSYGLVIGSQGQSFLRQELTDSMQAFLPFSLGIRELPHRCQQALWRTASH